MALDLIIFLLFRDRIFDYVGNKQAQHFLILNEHIEIIIRCFF